MPDYDLVPKSPAGRGALVRGDVHCRHCSYNLKGLPKAGLCPECGKAVAISLKGELLRYSPGAYLKSIDFGLVILLSALWLYVVLLIASIFLHAFAAGTQQAILGILAEVLMLLSSVVFVIGYWKFTTPDPSMAGREGPVSARRIARIAACVQLGVKAMALPFTIAVLMMPPTLGKAPLTPPEIAALILRFIETGVWAVLILSVLMYTRILAWRIPDEELAVRAKHFIWFLPVVFLVGSLFYFIGPIIALIFYASMLQTLRQHTHDTLDWQLRGGRHAFPS